MRVLLISIVLSFSLTMPAWADDHETGVPKWFAEEIAVQTANDGIWKTDNAAYMGDEEPVQTYVLQWSKGIGGTGMTGKMWGVTTDGTKTGNFWEFRSFWHPGKGKVIAEQWGFGGAYLGGTMAGFGETGTYVVQEMVAPDGTTTQSGHAANRNEDGSHLTISYNITKDGSWEKRREYVWVLQPAKPAE